MEVRMLEVALVASSEIDDNLGLIKITKCVVMMISDDCTGSGR